MRLDVTKSMRLGTAPIRIYIGFPPIRLQSGQILRNNADVA